MQDHPDAPRRTANENGNDDATAPRGAGATLGRGARLGLSIGGGVLSLAALQPPALAGACSDGVLLETPDQMAVISPDGAVSCIVVGDALVTFNGLVAAALVPLGAPNGTTTYSYSNQELQPVTESGVTTTIAYDFGGQPTSYTDQLGKLTRYTYQYGSGDGELTQVTNPDGTTLQYQYDPSFHQLTQETDALGRVTTYTYNTGTLAEDTLGQITTFTYSNGLLQSETNPGGFTTTFTYDGGELSEIDQPGSRITTYSYDGGMLSSTTDPSGTITTFAYDPQGQMSADSGNSDGGASFADASSIPEPSTLTLLLSGLVGWVGLRRRNHLSRTTRGTERHASGA